MEKPPKQNQPSRSLSGHEQTTERLPGHDQTTRELSSHGQTDRDITRQMYGSSHSSTGFDRMTPSGIDPEQQRLPESLSTRKRIFSDLLSVENYDSLDAVPPPRISSSSRSLAANYSENTGTNPLTAPPDRLEVTPFARQDWAMQQIFTNADQDIYEKQVDTDMHDMTIIGSRDGYSTTTQEDFLKLQTENRNGAPYEFGTQIHNIFEQYNPTYPATQDTTRFPFDIPSGTDSESFFNRRPSHLSSIENTNLLDTVPPPGISSSFHPSARNYSENTSTNPLTAPPDRLEVTPFARQDRATQQIFTNADQDIYEEQVDTDMQRIIPDSANTVPIDASAISRSLENIPFLELLDNYKATIALDSRRLHRIRETSVRSHIAETRENYTHLIKQLEPIHRYLTYRENWYSQAAQDLRAEASQALREILQRYHDQSYRKEARGNCETIFPSALLKLPNQP